jgi:hypothetical protein
MTQARWVLVALEVQVRHSAAWSEAACLAAVISG